MFVGSWWRTLSVTKKGRMVWLAFKKSQNTEVDAKSPLKYFTNHCRPIHLSLSLLQRNWKLRRPLWNSQRPWCTSITTCSISTYSFVNTGYMTWYLLFFLHRFLVNFCSTPKCVNRDKFDFASKQHRSQEDSSHCKYVNMSSNHQYIEQFPKLHMTNCSTLQTILSCGENCLLCEAKLLHINFFAPQT